MADPRQRLIEQIPRLRRYARALLGDPAQADELVQETLARALARLDRWEPGTDLRAWLFTLMHHLQVDRWRRKQREAAALAQAPGTDSVPDAGPAAVEVGELERALARLPEEQREVLLLVGLEGLAYRQVAEVLDIPQGTVMSRLHRAREALRAALDGRRSGAVGMRRIK